MKKIMLVDDDADLIALLQLKLKQTGEYQTVATTDAREAVKLAQENQPDLILLDIDMPVMDGGAVKLALADTEETRGIPVLFLSSIVTRKDILAQHGVIGGQEMISKSMNVEELSERIKSMLER